MQVKSKIMEQVKSVLSDFGNKYIDNNGALKRNMVIEDLNHYDKDLMTALLSNSQIHDQYTEKVADTEVFKLNQFIDVFEYKEFWEDSFTKYANRIGLTSDGKFISDSSDVVLDFPYKDAVLKAGMTKEDVDKKDAKEPFLNETLAHSEISELFEPKILVNDSRYDKDGEHNVISFNNDDNLVIKGNNLIALHSILKRYAGKIKLIYLDPPYNTGNDSFKYNDNFNHSTWLTFMKNRLDIAKQLLSPDGLIWVQTDDGEMNYIGVLMDSVFGRDNYINTITVKTKISGVSGSSEGKSLRDATEFIQMYAKDKNFITLNSVYENTPIVQYVHQYKDSGKSWKYTQVLKELGSAQIIEKNDKYTYKYYPNAKMVSLKQFAQENSITEDEVYQKYPEKVFRTTNAQSSVRTRVKADLKAINDGIVSITYTPIKGKNAGQLTEVYYTGKGKDMFMFLAERLSNVDGKLMYQQKLSTLWDNIQYNNLKKEGSVNFPAGKKPEKLLSNIIELSTNPGDIVMDFFGGSGSTAATAMKMRRRFITIEQISSQIRLIKKRLQNVIHGDNHGVSNEVNWQGGGSFVYAELMEKNMGYLKDLENATTIDELNSVYQRMKQGADYDFRIDLSKYENDPERKSMSLEDQKELLIKMLNKNQLYFNEDNIDDADVRDLISDSDYQFNKSFYGKGNA
ncbi:DNA methyltransferase [Limosilactobacillus fermentum]|uniref:DNA methyltransferase n=2 Tax=Lactobacillaceae TaxID=33958 RepID=UPI0021C01C09|nr:site-specific DNA-methyltransferase [Limosilactobacillus fermentum]